MAKQYKKKKSIESVPKENHRIPQVVQNNIPIVDFFEKLGNKAWLVSFGLILIVALFIFKDYLLFNKVYLFKDIGSDTLNVFYPYMYYAASQIGLNHIPKWAYESGMGQNIFPIIFHDPFDIFLFIAGKDNLSYHIIFKEVAKIILGGTAFFFYLRTLKLSNYTAIVGSICFSFCSFMIVGGGWYILSYEAFNVSVLLLSFELLLMKKKWQFFPIAIFLTAIAIPFDLYLYGLFLSLYAILRCYHLGITDWRKISALYLQMIGLGVVGMLLGAPILIQNIFSILESPRGGGSASYIHILSSTPIFNIADNLSLGTSIMRFFSSDILGSGNNFKGTGNIIEAPMFYCGIPCLILMPQVFQFLEKKVKIIFAIFLSLWLLPIIFPYFRYAFWLFSGDYFRAYSFFVALVFIYFSVHALNAIIVNKKINLIVLVATVVILLFLTRLPLFPDREIINSPVYAFAITMLFVYGILLYFIAKQNSSPTLKYLFLVAVVFEFIYLSGITVNERDAVTAEELSQKIGYKDYSLDAVKYINSIDHSFFRIDKNYASSPAMHFSINDGLVEGYRGTSSYNSFNQINYINYLGLMDVLNVTDESQTRWAMGLVNRPILESENRVKYFLGKKNINPMWQVLCDSVGVFGDVKVFRNKYVLPVGYTYHQYIKTSVFKTLKPTQKDFVSLRAFVIDDKDVSKLLNLKEFQLKDTIPAGNFSFDVYRQYVNELSLDTLTVNKFDEHEISGTVNLPDDRMMYLSIPFDEGWSLQINDLHADKIMLNMGMTGILLKKGHNKVVLTYHQRYFELSELLSLAGVLIFIGLLFYKKTQRSV